MQRKVGLTVGDERSQRRPGGGGPAGGRRLARGRGGHPAAGDLIREVNSTEVGTAAEFERAAARARRGGQLVLLVQRGYAAERIGFELE